MKKKSLVALILAQALFFALPAVSASQNLWGKIFDSNNKPIAGVQVKITQGGNAVSSLTTAADGAYTFNLNSGTYSMQLLPPTGYSQLYAYGIAVPQTQATNFTLTSPIPGRTFLTGHVVASKGFVLDYTNALVKFGMASGYLKDQAGTFYLTPTAGTVSSFAITGTVSGASTAYNMVGKTPLALNQDTIAELTVPFFNQKIRVVTAEGQPVANTYIYGGVGSLYSKELPNQNMLPLEGLGNFEGSWKIAEGSLRTDANGYISITALQMANPSPATFWVGGSSQYKYASQTFQTTVGNGEITLTLTQKLPFISGTIKDQNGKPIPGISIGFVTNNPGTNVQQGGGSAVKADGSFEIVAAANDNYIVSFEYKNADDPYKTFVYKTWGDKTNLSIPKDKNINLVVPLQTTRVRVLDPNGAPIANSYVSLKTNPNSSTEYSGKVSPIAGRPALNTYLYTTGVTDSAGFVSLPTLKFDIESDGLLFAAPPAGSALTYSSVVQKIGTGKDLSITLMRPLVNVSGKISLSDSAPFLDRISLSFSSGKGDSASLNRDAQGNFTGKIVKGINATWWVGCGAVDITRATDFKPCFGGGPSYSTSSDIKQDLVIPSYKTSVQVVDAFGKGIPNVKVLVNTEMGGGSNTAQLIAGQVPFSANFLSLATTDANGYAFIESVQMAKPQRAYILLTPDQSSRYQTRDLWITVGDNSKNVIVLEIPKPVVNGVTIATINGVRTATIVGDNFLGVLGVTAGSYTFNDFTNKTGVRTTQGFTVVDKYRITFPVPQGLTSATVTVTNGGGSATSTVIKFNQ